MTANQTPVVISKPALQELRRLIHSDAQAAIISRKLGRQVGDLSEIGHHQPEMQEKSQQPITPGPL